MNKKILISVLFLFFSASCQVKTPAVSNSAFGPTTEIPVPTFPTTLTPIFPLPTSTPYAISTVEVSKTDDGAIERANQEIPLYRQGNLSIKLHDSNGKPLSGYIVHYQQISHQFRFMSFEDWPSNIRYLSPSGFNGLTLNLWWTLVEPEEGKFNLDFVNYYRNIEELHQGGFYLKAQGIFFPTGDPTDIPSYLYGISFDDLTQIVEAHMSTLVRRFAPYIDRWEAINEPDLTYRNPFHLTKEQYLKLIQTSASSIRKNDPSATIEINFSEPCREKNDQMLQDILNAGIDFDVVGLQFYYNSYVDPQFNYQPPRLSLAEISSCLDKYEKLVAPYGKRIAGSEVSIPSEAPNSNSGYWGHKWDDDLKAQYLTAIYAIFFSKPTNMSINYWGSFDPGHFIWKGGLFDANSQPKKAFYALQDLFKSWTTSSNGVTDANGELTLQGFGGKYEIVITDPNTKASMKTTFDVQEQKSETAQIVFVPNNDLLATFEKLQSLANYWDAQSNTALAQKGLDYLALANHYIEVGERNNAEQALNAGLDDLAIPIVIHIPGTQLKGYYGFDHPFMHENGGALLWSAGTAYYPYHFPAGKVQVVLTANGRQIDGKYPLIVVGVGDKYSEPSIVTDGYKTYSYTFTTTGTEQILTIRFLYQESSNSGEWKLYINGIDVKIVSDELPAK
jgi:GH35 family endo-1,4-beta-xylanase